jgi:hypothetical protein
MNHSVNLGVDGRIILKWILKRNEFSGSIKGGEFLDQLINY